MISTNKIKEMGKDIWNYTRVAAALGVFYLGVTVAVNTPVIVLQAGIESILNQPTQEYMGILRAKKEAQLLGTHGFLNYGIFELEDGSTKNIYDGLSVLKGKLFANTEILELKVDRSYRLSTIGSETWGYTLLDAHEITE